MLRESRADKHVLETAYNSFVLPGVGRSFFTKWFTFAGHRPNRAWQPIILDQRVVATINRTLDVLLRDLASEKSAGSRYRAYIEAVHNWAEQLSGGRVSISAERLEWILFRHNGAEL